MNELILTRKNFEEELLKSDIPVLVDFWAPWCGPCKSMMPIVERIAEENIGKIKVGKVNVDEESELAEKFNIMSIPTFIVFKEGKINKTSVGFQDKTEILKMFN